MKQANAKTKRWKSYFMVSIMQFFLLVMGVQNKTLEANERNGC